MSSEPNRILIYAPSASVRKWIADELAGEPISVQVAQTVRDVVNALVTAPRPRPELLVADVDSMSPADTLALHELRQRGWFGTFIALGAVSAQLKASLDIEHVFARPLGSEVLRKAVSQAGIAKTTQNIRRIAP